MNKQKIKILISNLLIKENISLTYLAELIKQITGNKESRQGLSRKVNNATLKLSEFLDILEILNYELELRKTYKVKT